MTPNPKGRKALAAVSTVVRRVKSHAQAGNGKNPKIFGNGHNFFNFENWADLGWSFLMPVKFPIDYCRANFTNGSSTDIF